MESTELILEQIFACTMQRQVTRYGQLSLSSLLEESKWATLAIQVSVWSTSTVQDHSRQSGVSSNPQPVRPVSPSTCDEYSYATINIDLSVPTTLRGVLKPQQARRQSLVDVDGKE